MKSTKGKVTLNEYEALALHKHYREMAKSCKEKGLLSIVEEYSLKSDKWLDLAIEIARESDRIRMKKV
jgi:hypothetical protein